jgi:hypothetical protein
MLQFCKLQANYILAVGQKFVIFVIGNPSRSEEDRGLQYELFTAQVQPFPDRIEHIEYSEKTK